MKIIIFILFIANVFFADISVAAASDHGSFNGSGESSARNEAIRKILKEKPWPEAKAEIQKILKQYSKKRGRAKENNEPGVNRSVSTPAVKNISAAEAESSALKVMQGKVVDVKEKNGAYKVKILSEGKLFTVYVDSLNGEILGKKLDD